MPYSILYPFALSSVLICPLFVAHSLPSCQSGERVDKNGVRCTSHHNGGSSLIQTRKRMDLQSAEGARKPPVKRGKRKRKQGKRGKGTSKPAPSMMSCDSIRESGAPQFSFIGDVTAEDFVEDTFNNYTVKALDAVQCRVKFTMNTAQVIPSDPTGKVPNPHYNAHVSTSILGLPRPIKVGDILVSPYNLGNPWTDTNPPSPDPYLSISSDLQAFDPGTNQPFGLPDATVTCANSSHHATVGDMRCAYCDIPNTCLIGMGCFGYFAAECHFDKGSAKEAAELMVQTLKPAVTGAELELEPES